MQAVAVKMQTFLLNGSQQAGVDTHDLPTQEQKKMKYCSLSVASLALLWYGAAHAQTENTSTNTSTWPAHNRYVALNLGQQQQQYRELDTQGLTTNGTLNAETGRQQHLGAAVSYQTTSGWLLGLDAQRQTGATAYSGYLQAGNGSLSVKSRPHRQRRHPVERTHRVFPERRHPGIASCSPFITQSLLRKHKSPMRYQPIKTQQTVISAVSLAATQLIIHSDIGAKMRNLFEGSKLNLMAGGLVLAVLTACGGGGGEGSTHGQQFSSPNITFSGTAATGMPVANSKVVVVCASGSAVTTTTTVEGNYTLSLTDKLPCVFTVKLPNGDVLHSLSNQDGIVNITTFTELGYQVANADPTKLDSAKMLINKSLRQDFGIFFDGDPFTTPFIANRIGYDFELERFSLKISEAYPSNTGAGVVLPISNYSRDITTGTTPSAISNPATNTIKVWLTAAAVNTLSFLDSALPKSFVVDTSQYQNQPDFVRIVGGFGANTWNYLLAMPAEAVVVASDNLTASLIKFGHKDAATGSIVWDFTESGNVGWQLLKGTATAIGSVASPGKAVGALCATSNDLSNGAGGGVSYEDNKTYCDSLASISDIFFSAKDFIGNARDVGIAASKFKTSWILQYKNKTALMTIARSRSLKNMFKGAFDYAIEVSDVNDAFSVNNLNAVRSEYASVMREMGFASLEIDASLKMIACPARTLINGVGQCETPLASSLTPATPARVGSTTTFNITGTNLPPTDHLDITFNGCTNIQFVSQSAAQHQFTCTPNVAGTLTAVIRTLPGTTPLGSFPVAVSTAPLLCTPPQVQSNGACITPANAPINIPATSFANGLNVALSANGYGTDTLMNAPPYGGVANAADWMINAPPGKYELFATYASGLSRPVTISFDGTTVFTNALAAVTGGFFPANRQTLSQGIVQLPTGAIRMRVTRGDVFPHIKAFTLVPVSQIDGSFQVNANARLGTSFTVPNGVTSCTFNATGNWLNNGVTSNANGDPTFPRNVTLYLQSAYFFSLIAKSTNGYQFIGVSQVISVAAGQTFSFMTNEGVSTSDFYYDNSGSLLVSYTCH